MWWWHVYDAHSKWQLTDPGPSLISRPIPTAFLLLPSFILQPMKFSSFSQTLLLPLLEMVKRSSTIKEIQRPHYLIDQEYHKTEQMLSQAAFKGLVVFKQNFFGVSENPVSMLMSCGQLFHFICWLLTYQFATAQTQRLSHYPTLAFSWEVKLLLRVVNMKPVVTILLLIGVTFIVIVILLHLRQHSW